MLCYSVLYSEQLLVKARDQPLPLFNNVKDYIIYLCKIKNDVQLLSLTVLFMQDHSGTASK